MGKLKLRFLVVLVSIASLWPSAVLAANGYIRPGAQGSANGSDWQNAFPDMPSTFVRGDTYYVAAGNYGPHDYSTPVSGTLRITIKKATVADHGTDVGWQDSYANGPAVFEHKQIFHTSFWTFDGVTGSGNVASSYGFKIVNSTCGVIDPGGQNNWVWLGINTGERTDNMVISHVFLQGCGPSFDIAQAGIFAGWSNSTSDTVLVSYVYVTGMSNAITFIAARNWTIERSYFDQQWSSPSHHGEPINAFSTDTVTFRFNVLGNCEGTACISTNSPGNLVAINNWSIYGNVFSNSRAGNGIIAGTSYDVIANTRVYNNTVANSPNGGAWFQDTGCTSSACRAAAVGNVLQNNLIYNSNASVVNNGGPITINFNAYFDAVSTPPSEPNRQLATGDPLVNSAAGDFRLRVATQGGNPLPPPYGVDPLGVIRGTDGVWDRGAFELAPATPPPAPGNLTVQ